MNSIFVVGNITNEPEVKSLADGKQVASFTVATNRSYRNDKNEKIEEAQFHRVVVWGGFAAETLFWRKGARVYAIGRLEHRTWEKADKTTGYASEIVASEVGEIKRRDRVPVDG